MQVASLVAIHRYPVKSMLGETLEQARLGELGLPGDRAWAVRDEVRGGIQGGKKLPGLMACASRYLEEPGAGPAPSPEIALPDGRSFLASDPDAARRIGAAIDREVTLWPIVPPEDLAHYRRAAPDHADLQHELRAIFGREPGEPLPDIGRFPPELLVNESPPGSYFDAFPVMLLSRQSLRSLQRAAPDSKVDVRRFRPNLVVDAPADVPFPEQHWIGRSLQIGTTRLEVVLECPRCVMTTHGFADVPKDPRIMRTLVKQADGNLGVYARVATPGVVRVGDAVELLPRE